jgi:NDP-sugar pyrophosphorylase family protein
MTPTSMLGGPRGAKSATRTGVQTALGPSTAALTAIVLAGGYRSTERALAGLLPRPLMPVALVPLVGHVLRWLQAADITRLHVCTNGYARAIDACLAGAIAGPARLSYVEDPTPRGPAGCARDAALASDGEIFVVVDGSVVPAVDLDAVLTHHVGSGAAMTAVVHEEAGGRIGSGPRVAPAGIYVFSRRALEAVASSGFQDIKEHLIPALRRRHERVSALVAREISPRVIDAETYLAVNHWAIEQIPTRPGRFAANDAVVVGQVAAHPSASVHPRAQIIGPAVLGPGVAVGPYATVVGPVSLGANTVIGARAVVSRSVVWDHCAIGEGAFVDHALLANDVRVERGTIVEREVRQVGPRRRGLNWRDLVKPRAVAAPQRPVVDPALP